MSNSTMIEGDDIALFQLMALESSLLLETKGLKFSRGLSVYALIKRAARGARAAGKGFATHIVMCV